MSGGGQRAGGVVGRRPGQSTGEAALRVRSQGTGFCTECRASGCRWARRRGWPQRRNQRFCQGPSPPQSGDAAAAPSRLLPSSVSSEFVCSAAGVVDTRPVEPWQPGGPGKTLPVGGRVILFSQIRECASIIESWVRHYAALGFFKILLYLDDPQDVSRRVLEESGWVEAGFVELIDVDDTLRNSWQSMPSWGRVGSYCNMEVQSRQILNNEHAMLRARKLGADWLLHVDCDELLCLRGSAPAFFADLTARGCTMYTLNNVEGVPQSADSTDVLRSVRVFRQNMGLVPRNPKAGAAFFSWQLRLGGWFISYENGKSAVSVKHAVRCLSVCMWEVRPQIEPCKARAPDGSTCTWYTNNHLLWEAAVGRRKEGRLAEEEEVPRLHESRDALLLHFCVCDFASFWRKRWTQLGYLSASDQFRVRASSGAMMSRFYRLQREGRQADARELYELMCVCESDEVLETHLDAGVLLRCDPEGRHKWPPSRRPVRYARLAEDAEVRGAHFDAWLLWGKACEDTGRSSAVALHRRRAACALVAGLAASALADLDAARSATGDHEVPSSSLLRSQVLESLGRNSQAMELAQQALDGGNGVGDETEQLRSLLDRLRQGDSVRASPSAPVSHWHAKLPTPAELQHSVIRAVRPDPKDSRLYMAVLLVAMGWWQEVGGDERQFANALGRAAIAARTELAAVDSCLRPRPIRAVRELWDLHEARLKQDGACSIDLQQMPPEQWLSVAKACRALLGDRESITIAACNQEDGPGQPFALLWAIFCALAAEVARDFGIHELGMLTELRLARPLSGTKAGGPEVDNGGLLPDNRREVSFRIFVPSDGGHTGPPASMMLRTKDGERSLSLEVRTGRAFVWWSRQTFHQVLGAEGYFAIAGWAVVPQKVDRARQSWH
mmetsp:Transcript_70486/g.228415  ORF Transcript_70486/g.228415 Transcript_70486/m.228415 type:complete len:897 (-) Transcript_70486:91-2781(-)